MNIKETAAIIVEEYKAVFDRLDEKMIEDFIEIIKSHKRIFFIGVGREGMATRAFCMRIMHMGYEAHWIWDDTTPGIQKGDLLIATNGGGTIGHINYVCDQAKKAGADIVIVTGSPDPSSEQYADFTVFIPACVYRGKADVVPSIQPMGNLFEQCLLITFDLIIMKMVDEDPDQSFEKMSNRHRNVE
ncbi:MAG: SIS domain-containing protein [Lachnospiraceae bacterium]|nr:SIS domain-containing protein [Candidatus Equihabitans merdae]